MADLSRLLGLSAVIEFSPPLLHMKVIVVLVRTKIILNIEPELLKII